MTKTVAWREVSCFLILATGGAWLTSIPLWTSDVDTADHAFLLVSVGTMSVPALATAVTTLVFRPRDGIARSTGLLLPRPRRRLWTFGALGFGYPITAAVLALPIGILIGVAHLDLDGWSGLRSVASAWLGTGQHDSVALTAVAVTAVTFLIGLVPCFGEEWGWRGYLIPRLLPLGTWPALLLSGALWAFWHTPLLLRGFNYDSTGAAGIVEMTVSCVLAGIILGWLDIRSGSVWPAVVAHSCNNTFAVLITAGVGTDTAHHVDPLLTQIPVWLTTAAVVVVLHRTGQLTASEENR